MRHIWILLAMGAALLSACSPSYRTDYQYIPPLKETGRSCANNCLVAKTNCNLACTTQEAQCYRRVQLQDSMDDSLYRGGYWNNGIALSASPGMGYGGMYGGGYNTTVCRADACLGSCEESYQKCFTDCGGKVTSREVCIAHCPNGKVSH